MGKTAIVAGATGLIGRKLVHVLLMDPYYDTVVTLGRRTLQITNDKLIEVATDWTRESIEDSLRPYLKDADVFCALGTTMKKARTREQFRKVDYEYPILLGELAKKGRADQFLLVSSMGADSRSAIFYSRVKGELEEMLREMGLQSLHIFRPSLLLGEREEFRFGEQIGQVIGRRLSWLLVGKLRQYRPIPAAVVAKGMVRAAQSRAKGVTVYLSEQLSGLGSEPG